MYPGGCYNTGYPSLRNSSQGQMLFPHNLFLICSVIVNFCTEHGSDTAMLCAKFQNDLTNEIHITDE